MIKQLNKEIDKLDDSILASDKPKQTDVIGIVKIALNILLIILKALQPFTRNEKRRLKLKRWITWIETGTVITTILKT